MYKKITLFTFSLLVTIISHAQTWTNIGPGYGGYLRDFVFHPSNPDIIFVGGDDSSGIWISEDGGQTWRLVSEELPDISAWNIQFDKTDPNVMYACDLYNRYGVAKSIDGGENWMASDSGLTNVGARTVSKIAVVNQDTLFISTGLEHNGRTGDGIYKSTDGGQTWIATGLQGLTCPAIIATSSGKLIAATQGQGLKFSDDLGGSWQNHSDVSPIDTVIQVEIKDSFIVVSTNPSGIYVSSDNGATFNNIGGGAFDLAIGKTQPNLTIYSAGVVLLKADYNYTTQANPVWTFMYNTALLQDSAISMGIGAKNDTVMIGQLGNSQLFMSTDAGSSWTNTATSPSANCINDVTIDPVNPQHIFASLVVSNSLGKDKKCLIETTNGGSSWARKGPEASGYKIKFHPDSPDTLLCGTFTDGLFKSVDGGNTWVNKRPVSWINDIVYHPDHPNEVLISEVDNILNPASVEILKSIDGGETFTSVFSGLNLITKIIHIPNSDSVIASTNWDGLYLSTDRGDNWAAYSLPGKLIKTIAYNNGSIYAGSDTGQLYKVNSAGVENITGPWGQLTEMTNICFFNNIMYVGLNGAEHDRDTTFVKHGGVWYSTNDGQSWTDISAGLTCSQLYGNNVISTLNGKLLVGTYGGSFFTLDSLTGITQTPADDISLHAYPNPFDHEITINIPKTNDNKIHYRIIDIEGRVIQFAEIPCQQKVTLDLSRLKDGTYFFVLYNGQKIFHQKIIKQ